jgi:hypothetical protein
VSILALVSVLAKSFLVLVAEGSFVFAVDFNVFVETVFPFLTVAFLKVFAPEFFVTWMVWIGEKLFRIIFPAN